MLATGSTVFYAMLYGGLAGEQGEEVNVPDVDPEAFLAMLRWLGGSCTCTCAGTAR